MKKDTFDYYIFIDYSKNLIGYNIIKTEKINRLIPKISRFRHYKGSKDRKIYLKHIKNTIQRENIKSYFEKTEIKESRKNIDCFIEIIEFIKKNNNCVVFVSVDDKQYKIFEKMIKIIDNKKVKIIKENQLKKGSIEYQLSLIIDNLLNIERRKD